MQISRLNWIWLNNVYPCSHACCFPGVQHWHAHATWTFARRGTRRTCSRSFVAAFRCVFSWVSPGCCSHWMSFTAPAVVSWRCTFWSSFFAGLKAWPFSVWRPTGWGRSWKKWCSLGVKQLAWRNIRLAPAHLVIFSLIELWLIFSHGPQIRFKM